MQYILIAEFVNYVRVKIYNKYISNDCAKSQIEPVQRSVRLSDHIYRISKTHT